MNNNSVDVTALTLSGIALFSGLDDEERKEVSALCRARCYHANDQVFSHLDTGEQVFFVVSGKVRVTIISARGQELSFRELDAGNMFGELSAIDGQPRSAHVVAVTDATLVFLGNKDFLSVLARYADVRDRTMRHLTRLVRLLSDRVVELSTLGVKNRIHAELLRLGRMAPGSGVQRKIEPAPTHSQIAGQVSAQRETVSREMTVLTKQGLVQKRNNTLVILDMERLERMVDEVSNTHR